MDCDFSHAPWDLPRLTAKGLGFAELAIGSRYVRGGCTVGWSWHRRLLSKSANLYTKLFLGFGTQDWTAGFRCYRAEALGKRRLRSRRGERLLLPDRDGLAHQEGWRTGARTPRALRRPRGRQEQDEQEHRARSPAHRPDAPLQALSRSDMQASSRRRWLLVLLIAALVIGGALLDGPQGHERTACLRAGGCAHVGVERRSTGPPRRSPSPIRRSSRVPFVVLVPFAEGGSAHRRVQLLRAGQARRSPTGRGMVSSSGSFGTSSTWRCSLWALRIVHGVHRQAQVRVKTGPPTRASPGCSSPFSPGRHLWAVLANQSHDYVVLLAVLGAGLWVGDARVSCAEAHVRWTRGGLQGDAAALPARAAYGRDASAQP